MKINGRDTLLAREVKQDGNVVTLRNAQGVPEWAREIAADKLSSFFLGQCHRYLKIR